MHLIGAHLRAKFQICYIIIQSMANNKSRKMGVSGGAQFTSTDLYFEQEEPSQHNEVQVKQNTVEREEEHFLSLNEGRNPSSSSRQEREERRSLNHNFQKHAVVTIKKLMRMKHDVHASPQQKVAYQMWNIFEVTEIKSKKLLVVLFGAANLSDESNWALFLRCGFQDILQESEIVIRKAQQILRKRFMETVTEQLVRQNIRNFRNIKASSDFLIYFCELLELIRKGPLLKLRINSRTAKKIEASIKQKKTNSRFH